MSYKIGVFGSSDEEVDAKSKEKAKELGRVLSSYKLTIITGACSGLPYLAASYGSKNGNPVWGYSPKLDLEGQRLFTPKDNLSIYEKLIYVPKYFVFSNDGEVCKKYRNVISTANCDAAVVISGRWGTMNEFTNLFDMGKVIGVLTRTDGIADELPHLMKKIHKKSKAKVLFSSSPKELVGMVIKELRCQ